MKDCINCIHFKVCSLVETLGEERFLIFLSDTNLSYLKKVASICNQFEENKNEK